MDIVPGTFSIHDSQFYRGTPHLTLETHAMHYGTACFEGIRAYRGVDGHIYVLHLEAHLDRLFYSAQKLQFGTPNGEIRCTIGGETRTVVTRGQLREEILDLIAINFPQAQQSVYIRPIIYVGDGLLVNPTGKEVHYGILAQEWGPYYLEPGMMVNGFRKEVQYTFTDPDIAQFDPKAKISGNYVMGAIAKAEVSSFAGLGISEPLMLNGALNVTEASGASLFIAEGNRIITPQLEDGVLKSITRQTFFDIAGQNNQETLSLERVLKADTVFLTGTAVEFAPIEHIYIRTSMANDLRNFGKLSDNILADGEPMTLPYRRSNGIEGTQDVLHYQFPQGQARAKIDQLAERYTAIATGKELFDSRWLTHVPDKPSGRGLEQVKAARTVPPLNGQAMALHKK